jgi:hypothetical protein
MAEPDPDKVTIFGIFEGYSADELAAMNFEPDPDSETVAYDNATLERALAQRAPLWERVMRLIERRRR